VIARAAGDLFHRGGRYPQFGEELLYAGSLLLYAGRLLPGFWRRVRGFRFPGMAAGGACVSDGFTLLVNDR
jgi:hypothetical protein